MAFGVVAASLVSAVEPAQAFSFNSNSSSYTSSLNSGSFNSFSAPTNSYGQSSLGTGSTNLLAQGTQMGGATNNWMGYVMLPLLVWMFIEGLEDKNSSGPEVAAVLGESVVKPPSVGPGGGGPGVPGGGPGGGPGNPPAPVPSPALFPGLVGMGLAAMRKRNRTEVSDQV